MRRDISLLCGFFEGNVFELQEIMNNTFWGENKPKEFELKFESHLFRKSQYKDSFEGLPDESVEDRIKTKFVKYLSAKIQIQKFDLAGPPFAIIATVKDASRFNTNSEILNYNREISKLEKKLINLTSEYKKNAKLKGHLEISIYLQQIGIPREIKIEQNTLNRSNMAQMILLDINDMKINIPNVKSPPREEKMFFIERQERTRRIFYRFEFDKEPEKHLRLAYLNVNYISPKNDLAN
jgi:hypothetical protein